jgi:hypothetical protein
MTSPSLNPTGEPMDKMTGDGEVDPSSSNGEVDPSSTDTNHDHQPKRPCLGVDDSDSSKSSSTLFQVYVLPPGHKCKSPVDLTGIDNRDDFTERNVKLANQTLEPNDTVSFPLFDNDAIMSAINAIPFSQDDTREHYSPFHKHHLKFFLKGQLVLQTGGSRDIETYQLLSSVFPFGSRTEMRNKLDKYYPGHALHSGQSTNIHLLMGTLKVEHCTSRIWKSQAGWIDDGMELTRAQLREVRELQNEESHFSGLHSHYSTSDTDALDLITDANYRTLLRNCSLSEMALFNKLAQAARTLRVDIERTHTMQTSIEANNDEGQSASADDVVKCLSEALTFDVGRVAQLLTPNSSSAGPNDVLGFLSIYKEMFPIIATLNDTKNLPGEMKLVHFQLGIPGNGGKIMTLWAVCTDKKLFERYSKLLLLVVRRVYSAENDEDLRLIISRICKFE